jgi:hypothetical protein
MIYILLFIIGVIIGALLIPLIIYFRAKHSGWDDSNIFNVFRVICHLALHPEDFIRMQYEDGKKPFWYLTKDEFSEVVDSRPESKKSEHNKELDPEMILWQKKIKTLRNLIYP